MVIIDKPGNILVYPKKFHCSKCACEFRVLVEEIQRETIFDEIDYCSQPSDNPILCWLAICCFNEIEEGVFRHTFTICPTPNCKTKITAEYRKIGYRRQRQFLCWSGKWLSPRYY